MRPRWSRHLGDGMEQLPQRQDSRADDATLVAAFVSRHFGPRGTWRLHGHAIGWDLVRAPVNVMLAPIYLIVRILALFLAALQLRGASRWLINRQILFRSDVSRAIIAAVHTEVVAARGRPADLSAAQTRRIEDYADTRNAVSEICTTFVVLILGFAVFRIITPGIVSLAPLISTQRLHSTAVANFPFGQRLGGVWYGWFPVDLPIWYVVAVGVGLACVFFL